MTIDVTIKNCNNIEEWIITIKENCLNIKYAINWTWKTTIWKALEYAISDKKDWTSKIQELKPFKYRTTTEWSPEIDGIDSVNSVLVFDESYVNQFVFTPDEIIKNSFSIFIENEEYKKWLQEIDNLTNTIKNAFQTDENINWFIGDLKKLVDSCGNSESGLHRSSKLFKALSKWNLIENVPVGLEDYSEYIKSDKKVNWLWRQIKGKDYLNVANKCPFCANGDIEQKKPTINLISEKYDPTVIEHLVWILSIFDHLHDYFSDEVNEKIQLITKNMDWLTDEQSTYLFDIKNKARDLLLKLEKIKNINFYSLKNVDIHELEKEMLNYKVDISYYIYFSSNFTSEKVKLINDQLDVILKEMNQLKKLVGTQNALMRLLITKHKESINDFLKTAWYNYFVDAVENGATTKLILKHCELDQEIKNAKNHLSFWERNAFAIVLFMFEVVSKQPDLIVLDDPISSFDKNKKFAILNMLFNQDESLKQRTVLMLTHDFEPIIDIIYNQLPIYFKDKSNCTAFFLTNIDWKFTEKIIDKSNIKSCVDVSLENAFASGESINKLIYLRRFCELNSDYGAAYNILSNLFHKRDSLLVDETTLMSSEDISSWCDFIKKYVTDFDYNVYLSKFKDNNLMIWLYNKTSNNYEKLQIYRIIQSSDNPVIRKFVNEAYHIENDYLFQLNPREYEIIPQYIIKECDSDLNKA